MRLPRPSELQSETARTLYRWDTREYFAVDSKNYWAVHYRNRLKAILDTVSRVVPPGSFILDIGCAQATAAILLAERGFKVIAVEARPEAIQYAKLRVEFGDVRFVCSDATKLSLDLEFDAILLAELLEHVPRPGDLLRRCKRILRQGGVVIITTPNGLSPHNWLLPTYNPKIMERPERAGVPSGLGGRDTHLFCFRPRQLSELVLDSGYTIDRHELLNSYTINPIGLHRLLSVPAIEKVNQFSSRIPILANFTTMTQFLVAKRSDA